MLGSAYGFVASGLGAALPDGREKALGDIPGMRDDEAIIHAFAEGGQSMMAALESTQDPDALRLLLALELGEVEPDEVLNQMWQEMLNRYRPHEPNADRRDLSDMQVDTWRSEVHHW